MHIVGRMELGNSDQELGYCSCSVWTGVVWSVGLVEAGSNGLPTKLNFGDTSHFHLAQWGCPALCDAQRAKCAIQTVL